MAPHKSTRVSLPFLSKMWAQLNQFYNVTPDGHCVTVRETANGLLTLIRLADHGALPLAKMIEEER